MQTSPLRTVYGEVEHEVGQVGVVSPRGPHVLWR
jgi:hypothetical protein